MKYFFTVLLFFNFVFAFDTPEGRYLSQQDLLNTLVQVFNLQRDSSSYKLSCTTIEDNIYNYQRNLHYELGFPSLLTGEKITQAPDANYILYIDQCVTKIYNDYYQAPNGVAGKSFELFESIFSSELKTNLKKQLNLNDLKTLGLSNWQTLTKETQNQIIDSIFIFIFGAIENLPTEYLNQYKLFIQQSEDQNININYMILKTFKAAIINEFFLIY